MVLEIIVKILSRSVLLLFMQEVQLFAVRYAKLIILTVKQCRPIRFTQPLLFLDIGHLHYFVEHDQFPFVLVMQVFVQFDGLH